MGLLRMAMPRFNCQQAVRKELLIEQTKQDIFSGSPKPGDQLEEAELAQRFRVSRTRIRETVWSMVDCGPLETRPGMARLFVF